MVFAIVGAAGLGLVIGLRMRAPALIVATFFVIVASIAASGMLQLPVQTTILTTLCLVAATQVAYLLGLLFTALWHR